MDVSDNLLELIKETTESVINRVLRENKMLAIKAVIAATINTENNTATVYFPEDMHTESSLSYINKTGRALVSGEKLYLIYQYDKLGEGWLSDNLPLNISPSKVVIPVVNEDPTNPEEGEVWINSNE